MRLVCSFTYQSILIKHTQDDLYGAQNKKQINPVFFQEMSNETVKTKYFFQKQKKK
jgi:hypothetical protein